jgi:hypothetical protein
VAEIETQRCASQFGCGSCKAGLGAVDTSPLSVNFAQVGIGSEYAGASANVTRIAGGVNVAGTGTNPRIQTNPASAGFDGDTFRYVTIHGRANVIPDTLEFFLLYRNAAAPFNAPDRRMRALNWDRPFRGIKALSNIKAGEEFTAVFDAADSPDYATEWQGKTIDGLRFDYGNNDDADFDVYSIQASANSLFDARGSECYRTRATCKDIENYRAVPNGHLVATGTYLTGDPIVAADYSRDGSAFFTVSVRAPTEPSGTILALGSATNFLYLGITGTDLVLAAGGNAATTQARATVAASTIAARTVTLIGEIDFAGDAVNLWEFDPITLSLTLLATDTANTALPALWAAATDGQVGLDGGNTYGTEDGGTWVGRISTSGGYDGILFDGRADEVWSLKQYFGRPVQEQPADTDKIILPYLADASTAPTKVSLAGSNRNTDPLGNRASVTLKMTDQVSSDISDDPYLSDRLFKPLLKDGSFWAKWRVRQRFGRVNARIRVYEGYRGQRLSEMRKREYLFDKLNLDSRAAVTIRGRDILSKAELGKSQVPVQSPGLLATALTAGIETTIQISNATVDDYPAPNTVRINKEIFTYSAVTVNGADPDIVDLTITSRASDRSEAAEHQLDDSVQLCRRYTDATVDEVLVELLADDAEIPAQNLDIANWELESLSFLSAYNLTTLITEPESVTSLVGSLMESVAAFLYWDERDQLTKLEALKALSTIPVTLSEGTDIVADSVSIVEKPREQLTRVALYYNPVSFAEVGESPINYLNGYIDANTDLEDDDALGQKQTRLIFTRWLTTNAQATQTASRLATRYALVPIEVTFTVDAKDGGYWIGDIFRMSHYQIVNAQGDADTGRNFIITSAEEIVTGEMIRYTAEDSTLGGFVALITSNGQGDYTGVEAIDGFYGFITTNLGLTSTGEQGSKIS